jgi:predicted PurR-regulated permease PerM
MFIYYILVDRTYLRNKFLEFFPPDLKEKAGVILYNITSRVGNYVRAQVLSMITVGVMVTLEVALLGIDYTILLGLIAGICEIIPLLGPAIAIAVLAAIAFPLGWTKIIIAILLFLAIQQISNYVIRPFVFGKFMKLHPINIMVAITAVFISCVSSQLNMSACRSRVLSAARLSSPLYSYIRR